MSKKEKLKKKIETKSNWNQITFDELSKYLIDNGYEIRQGKGSHVIFYSEISQRPFPVPNHRGIVKAAYIKKAVELINDDNEE